MTSISKIIGNIFGIYLNIVSSDHVICCFGYGAYQEHTAWRMTAPENLDGETPPTTISVYIDMVFLVGSQHSLPATLRTKSQELLIKKLNVFFF